jgi:RNA polymerase sigma factor (TIGR02999 family)
VAAVVRAAFGPGSAIIRITSDKEEDLPGSRQCDITGLLLAWRQGDEGALDALMPVVYAELRHVAHRHLHGRTPEYGLQTTALVHEAYLRLLGSSQVSWQNRAHFFALSAQLMRRVLVDAVRARLAQKRGGLALQVPLPNDESLGEMRRPDLVALDEALTELAAIDPRKAKVVELRYFGGLTADESAEALGVSRATVERDWRMAKLWLTRELRATPS